MRQVFDFPVFTISKFENSDLIMAPTKVGVLSCTMDPHLDDEVNLTVLTENGYLLNVRLTFDSCETEDNAKKHSSFEDQLNTPLVDPKYELINILGSNCVISSVQVCIDYADRNIEPKLYLARGIDVFRYVRFE
jgi:hypothetical protein